MKGESAEVVVDLGRVRANVAEIARRCGVPVIAVVKADAYGLGARQVARAIADLVEGFCVFRFQEAIEAELSKPTIVIGPPATGVGVEEYRLAGVRPAVSTVEQARALRGADPLLCVDTGMQRFACPAGEVEEAASAGGCREAFTHATNLDQVRQLVEVAGGRGMRLHAAGSSLLGEQEAWLDAVRPGLAMYEGAVTVRTRLVEARETRGPIGYAGLSSETGRHGAILVGYSQGLRPGWCAINGGRRRVIEVGMQSAYVELEPGDGVGDEVVLLGAGVTAQDLAGEWACPPHEVITQISRAGVRSYVE